MVRSLLVLILAAVLPVSAIAQDDLEPAEIKHVILFIGDGMGPQQLALLDLFARRAPSSIYADGETAFARLFDRANVTLSMTDPVDALVVDSACSATQLASGVHT
ncbi:MAG: alkaline phosphatase, partial [Myxococcales bacterium]|nr:alkaline phosphatase [Myxococcales bacterium]